MKKLIILTSIVLCFISSVAQPTHKWQTIHTGYPANSSKMVVTKNCLYLFNSNNSSILRSINRGVSWDSLYVPSDEHEHEYSGITFINDSVGYIAGYEGDHHVQIKSVVKKTTNRGLTWQTLVTQTDVPTAFDVIGFFSADTGMVFGRGTGITERFFTVDAGLNWTYLPNDGPVTASILSYWFKGKEGITTGYKRYLFIEVTHDYGNTWNTKEFPEIGPSKLKFFDSQHGIVVAEDSIYASIYATIDGANSFYSKAKFPYANVVRSFDMLDMKRGFYCTGESIYYTPDAGNSWTLSYNNPKTTIEELVIEGNDVFVSTFNDSIILKLDISDLTSGLHETKRKQNTLRIYPNPSTNNIYIANPENEKLLTVTITDQLGKIVLNQDLGYTKTIDIKGLPYGIYMVEIRSENETYINKLVIDQK